jgi:hypothetical protein
MPRPTNFVVEKVVDSGVNIVYRKVIRARTEAEAEEAARGDASGWQLMHYQEKKDQEARYFVLGTEIREGLL